MKNKKTRNDIILVAVILVIAAAGLLFVNSTRQQGQYAVVKIDGEEFCSFSLEESIEKELVTGDEKQFTNTLVIEEGQARISQANCPDKLCCQYRPVSRSGETIVCLPHRLVIEIRAEKADSDLDIIG